MPKYEMNRVEEGLKAIVLASGSVPKAAKRLEAAGDPVPLRTLRDWRDNFPERYQELEDSRNDWMGKQMADASEWLAAGYAEGEARLLANILSRDDEELKKLSPNVLAQAARNLSISRGVSIDKANELRQRPTRPDGSALTLAGALKTLSTRYGHVVRVAPELIEGEAEEVK